MRSPQPDTASPRTETPAERRARWASVAISPHATPTRNDNRNAVDQRRRMEQWEKDIPAYRRLRADGLQPKQIDGAYELETRADHDWQIDPEICHARAQDERGVEFVPQPGVSDGDTGL